MVEVAAHPVVVEALQSAAVAACPAEVAVVQQSLVADAVAAAALQSSVADAVVAVLRGGPATAADRALATAGHGLQVRPDSQGVPSGRLAVADGLAIGMGTTGTGADRDMASPADLRSARSAHPTTITTIRIITTTAMPMSTQPLVAMT